MERNDLIERLRETIADADSDIAGELLDAETTGEPIDPDDWQVEVPVGWLREAVGTITLLSEALAEAEKKGADAVAEICEAMADEDDVLAMREGLEYWEIFQHRCAERRLRHAAKVARDLSQGGQHG